MADRESNKVLTHLWQALNFRPRDIVVRIDFLLGLVGAGCAASLALITPDALLRTVVVAAGLIGLIVGAVIAGVAILTAFMDQAFLRKLRAIERNPVRYISVFLYTAVLTIVAMIALITLSAFSSKSSIALLTVISGFAAFFSFWAIGSLLYCLSALVQFMNLKVDALDVPDDPKELQELATKVRQAEILHRVEALLAQLDADES